MKKNIKNYKKIFGLFFFIFIYFSFFSNVVTAAYYFKNPSGNPSNICSPDVGSIPGSVEGCIGLLIVGCPLSGITHDIAVNNNYCNNFTAVCNTTSETVVCPTIDFQPVTGQKTTGSTDVYTLLAPIGEFKVAPKNIGDYFNTIFLIAIGLCGALAVIMIVIGGIQYMGDESIFGKTEAKSKITSAIFGLLIALGAYALLNTINPDLLGKGGVHIKQVSAEIDPEIHGDLPQQPTNGKYCNGKYTPNQVWPEGVISTDQMVRTFLSSKGIVVNKNACTFVGEQNCTSVAGLDSSKVIALKDKCGGTSCSITITGGTECWLHSNKTLHLPGKNIVDLNFSSSPKLVEYIEKGSEQKMGSMGFPIFIKDGATFMKEENHYHVISW